MPVSVKVGGAWKAAAAVYNKVGGVWKTAADMPVKIGGVWKTGILASGAYESIATATGTGSSGTITFSSIPSTYTHLQIRDYRKNDSLFRSGFNDLLVRFNSDSSASYTYHATLRRWVMPLVLSVAQHKLRQLLWTACYRNNVTANTMAVVIIDIHDYSVATKNKTLRTFNGGD
jgi:hypothetical protein